jgi:DNA-binding transcriptional LysR family regulator
MSLGIRDIHRLEVFLAVVQHGSFTRAAEHLFLTQSAVSHQIASMESDLGIELLTRSRKAVEPTAVGKVLAEEARRVMASLEQAESAVKLAARPGAGRLRIGASATACQHLIPDPLREFQDCFPDYSLSVTPGDSPQVAEAVTNGDVDLGIVIQPEQRSSASSKLDYHALFDDELGLIVGRLHPWAARGKVDRRDLPNQRLIQYSRSSTTFRLVERYFVQMQAPLRDPIELGSVEAIKELVKLGLGVSVMAAWVARPELARRSLVWLPLPGPKLKRRWAVANRAGRDLTLAEQTFVGLCKSASSRVSDAAV